MYVLIYKSFKQNETHLDQYSVVMFSYPLWGPLMVCVLGGGGGVRYDMSLLGIECTS